MREFMRCRKMKSILQFEWKKTWRNRRKNLIILVVISLVVCLSFIANVMMEHLYNANEAESIEYTLDSIDEVIKQLTIEKDNPEISEINQGYLKEKNLLEQQLKAIRAGDWHTNLVTKIAYDEHILNLVYTGKLIGGEPISMIENRLLLNQELLKRNIPPASPDYATSGFYNVKSVLGIFIGFIGIAIFLFLVGDTLSNEFEKGTIKLLFAEPVSRVSLINAKLIIAVTQVLFILLIIIILAFGIGTIFSGIGNYDYPILIQTYNGSEFLDLWLFLIKSSLFYIFVITFILLLQFFFSILTKNNLLATGLTIIVSILFYISVTKYVFLAKVAHLLPFAYLHSFSIVDGTLANEIGNPNVTVSFGVASLTITALILYVICGIILRNREV